MLKDIQNPKYLIIIALSHIIGKLIANSAVHRGFSTFIMNCMTNSQLSFSHWVEKRQKTFEYAGKEQRDSIRTQRIRKMYNFFMSYRIVQKSKNVALNGLINLKKQNEVVAPEKIQSKSCRKSTADAPQNAELLRLFMEKGIGSDTFCLKKQDDRIKIENRLQEFKRIFGAANEFI